jgi:hypothetical protein
MNAKGWSRRFFDPIILPDGRKLLTLRDAATYITGLPKAEHEAEEWQTAMETLLLVTERDGPEMMARIGFMKALNRHVEREFKTGRKEPHWGKRKLARDQWRGARSGKSRQECQQARSGIIVVAMSSFTAANPCRA